MTKVDKLFEFLVKEGRIKLPEGHSMLRLDGVKEKRYCGFHNRNSHSINECRVFRMRIQKAIQEGHLKFDNKMKLDGNPFPQNMVGFSVNMVVGVLDRQTYQGGSRSSRLCGEDRDRETENWKVCTRTRDTRFIQVRVAKVASPMSCLGYQVWCLALGVG
jgi:hypothetical protein